ncbi:MAG TPA: outer membrane beta-barrel protein [Burkholderiales bacterium]|nr:outer membrane beta-barrel protein [Burkholderiales bacterium]
MRKGLLPAVAALGIALGGPLAEAADNHGFLRRGPYIGGGLGGQFGSTARCPELNSDIGIRNVVSCDRSYVEHRAGKLFFGYQVFPYVAVEASHIWMGKFIDTSSGTLSGVQTTNATTARPYVLAIDAVGTLPTSNDLAILVRLGWSAWRIPYSTTSVAAGGSVTVRSGTDFGLLGFQAGTGVKYLWNRNLEVRAELQALWCCSINANIFHNNETWGTSYLASASMVYLFR